jgi:hypothetical protein
MTNPETNVLAHSSTRCAVCHLPWRGLLAEQTDAEAVDHLASHGPRAVAFALLVAEGHRLLGQHAHTMVGERVNALADHLDLLAAEQRAAVTGGEGF